MNPRAYDSTPSFKLIEAHSKNTLKNKAVELGFGFFFLAVESKASCDIALVIV